MRHGELTSPITIAFKHVQAASNIAYQLWQPVLDEAAVLRATVQALGEARAAIDGAVGVAERRIKEVEG